MIDAGSIGAGPTGGRPSARSASRVSPVNRSSSRHLAASGSASRSSASGAPNASTPRANGSASANRSQLPSRRWFEAAKVIGTIGTPVRIASRTTPGLARIRGPRGPSGVNTGIWPRSITPCAARSRLTRPRLVEPNTVRMPKRAVARAISRPSRWLELTTQGCSGSATASSRSSARQAVAIISMRPCQKAPMNGRRSRTRRAVAGSQRSCQRPVRWTSPM